jgi:hypothetical protein
MIRAVVFISSSLMNQWIGFHEAAFTATIGLESLPREERHNGFPATSGTVVNEGQLMI